MSLRQDILDVSKELLVREGFSKMSMRRIARNTGVSATSIYLYFKNKDDLLLTLIEESIEKLKQALISEVKVHKEPVRQLEDLARAYILYALNHPQEYEIIYMVRPEEMPRYPKEKFREVRSVYELISEVIQEAARSEQLSVAEPLISAYTLWAQLHGVVTVILSRRLDIRIPRDRFIDQAIEHIIQGFIIQKTPA